MSEKYGELDHVVPVGTDIPDVPKAFKDYDDSVVESLTAAKGKLLIAQNTGAAAWMAMKGDATLAEDGTLTLSASKIQTRRVKVDASFIANPTITWATAFPDLDYTVQLTVECDEVVSTAPALHTAIKDMDEGSIKVTTEGFVISGTVIPHVTIHATAIHD